MVVVVMHSSCIWETVLPTCVCNMLWLVATLHRMQRTCVVFIYGYNVIKLFQIYLHSAASLSFLSSTHYLKYHASPYTSRSAQLTFLKKYKYQWVLMLLDIDNNKAMGKTEKIKFVRLYKRLKRLNFKGAFV